MSRIDDLIVYYRGTFDKDPEWAGPATVDYNRVKKEIENDLDCLEKLEKVIEILKKKMTIETDYYDSDLGCEKFEYIAYNGEALNIETQEEYDLLKEVLKDE